MPEHTTTQCVLFPGIFKRPVVAKFDQAQGSSDGGAVLLKAADRELGLITALAACLKDDRQEGKVRHEFDELLTQRIMAIALGYEDANDAARLASDPVHKLLVGRDPVEGEDLASQPTLSRFENSVGRKELFRMAETLADTVIGECQYRTRKSWPWKRRVIYKAEVVRPEGKKPKDNPRFVVTNMKQSPQWLYEEVYCQRGDLENRIKELLLGYGLVS